MAVRSINLEGAHSFRGIGFIKIDGILYPVCGSKKFEFSALSRVVYNPKVLELVPPDQDRKATFRALVTMTGGDAVITEIDSSMSNSRILMETGDEEGIPKGVIFENAFLDNFRLMAPFRWVLPGSVAMENPGNTLYTDNRPYRRPVDPVCPAYYPDSYDAHTGTQFATEIFIP